jgi:eukaryotic-like serine/threonine-protein kinase
MANECRPARSRVNNTSRARQQIATALAEAPTRDVSVLAALGFSRIGDNEQAEKSHGLTDRFPLNTAINRYWLPAIYASIEITRGNPTKALEDLQTTAPYELGSPLPQFEVGGSLYPVYIRGEAYLLLRQGKEAAAEFQKFLDHRGIAVSCPLRALARLQLGRAYALQGGLLDPAVSAAIPLIGIVGFTIVIYASWRARRRPDAHKRLILVATMGLVTAAVGRFP